MTVYYELVEIGTEKVFPKYTDKPIIKSKLTDIRKIVESRFHANHYSVIKWTADEDYIIEYQKIRNEWRRLRIDEI